MFSHRNFIRTCLSQKSFCFIYGTHKYQVLATCNSPTRGSSGDRYLSRADVDADAIQYGGGCRSCAWPTDPLSRASACATLCHGNAKLEYTTRFHFRRFCTSRSNGGFAVSVENAWLHIAIT